MQLGAQRHTVLWLEVGAAFAVALTSAFAIADPRAAVGHGQGLVDIPIRLLVDFVEVSPVAAPLAAITAVAVCAGLRTSRWGWAVAAAAAVVQAVLRVPVTADLETELSLISGITAGVALGAVAATAWRHSTARVAVAVVAGFLGALTLKHLWLQDFTYRAVADDALRVAPMVPDPAVWPFAIAAVAAVATALIARPQATPGSPRQPHIALLGVTLTVVLVATEYGTAQWLIERRIDGMVAMMLLFAVTLVAALVLGRTDGPWSGTILLTTTAVVAASHLAGGTDISLLPGADRWWLLLVGVALVTGLALGVRLQHRAIRIVIALLVIAAVLEPGKFHSLTAIMFLGGFAIGVSLPGAGPVATTIALTVPATGVAFAATTDTVAYPNSSTRLALTVMVVACALGTVAVGWISQARQNSREIPSGRDAEPS